MKQNMYLLKDVFKNDILLIMGTSISIHLSQLSTIILYPSRKKSSFDYETAAPSQPNLFMGHMFLKYKVNAGWSQAAHGRCCFELSTRVLSHIHYLIVSHVDKTGPRIVVI
jgi:hypothetical protein